jgi:hypothetical protein
MQEQMHVRIDQSGQQNTIAQVEHHRARRMRHRRTRFHNALALHQHFPRLHNPPILYIKQTSRVQHNRAVRRRRRGLRRRDVNSQYQ